MTIKVSLLALLFFALASVSTGLKHEMQRDASPRLDSFSERIAARSQKLAQDLGKRVTLKQATRSEIIQRRKHSELIRQMTKTNGALRPRNSPGVYPDANPMPLSGQKYSRYLRIFINAQNYGQTLPTSDETSCIRYCQDYTKQVDGTKTCYGTSISFGNCRPIISPPDGLDSGNFVGFLPGDCASNKALTDTINPMFDQVCENVVIGAQPAARQYVHTDNLQYFDAPYWGPYQITMFGAGGGATPYQENGVSPTAGKGSGVVTTVYLNDTDGLYVVIGGKGKDGLGVAAAGGGGGGSFALLSGPNIPLAIGGGGGGAGRTGGTDASDTETASDGQGFGGGTAGTNQNGGGGGIADGFNIGGGGGGAGFATNGGFGGANTDIAGQPGRARGDFYAGGSGSATTDGGNTYVGGDGGYGGGGGGGVRAGSGTLYPGGGGGGGGYNGGGGGGGTDDSSKGTVGGQGAGGGSAYVAGPKQVWYVNNAGDGYGSIQYML